MADSLDWTPGEACRDAAKECDAEDADAVVCIILNRGPDGERFGIGFRNAGMTATEMLALVEAFKHKLLTEDIFPPDADRGF